MIFTLGSSHKPHIHQVQSYGPLGEHSLQYMAPSTFWWENSQGSVFFRPGTTSARILLTNDVILDFVDIECDIGK